MESQKINGFEHEITNGDRQTGSNMHSQRDILKHIIKIGTSLRLHVDRNTLFQHIASATREVFGFQHAVLYLSDDVDMFHVHATAGLTSVQERSLQQHPVHGCTLALLTDEQYCISTSYFIPSEAALWKNPASAHLFFTEAEKEGTTALPAVSSQQWQTNDLLLVPLLRSDKKLLGFLIPGSPIDNLRPTVEMMEWLELFASQVAIVIEGTRFYEEARRSSEERAALIEIGRMLSSPDALGDVQIVYRTIHEHVKRMMHTDAFFITHYYRAEDTMMIDYLVDEDIVYPPEAFGAIPGWVHMLLTHEKSEYLFSTKEEYKTFYLANLRKGDPLDDYIGSQRPSESLMFVPICYGEETIGLLSAQSYVPYAYTPHHIDILKELAVQAGIAIANARLYTDLRAALGRARESERMKNQFLMTASHELRTPLTAVQGYLELLSSFDDTLDPVVRKRFTMSACHACDELILLLENVMDTSRIDQEQIALTNGPVHLLPTVQLILEILEPTLTREHRPVEMTIPEELCVWADDLRLRQVLINILGNALKYTPVATKIAIHAERILWQELTERVPRVLQKLSISPTLQDEFVIVAVRDWGQGINAEDQQRLFTRFTRLSGAINSSQRGVGLGLYLCDQWIEAMGGCIWIESSGTTGEGTTFLIALPRYTEGKG